MLTYCSGSITSSYPVHDRTQVADLDESLLIDDYDELEAQPCPICGLDDHEEVLLQCDGCDGWYHTYCVDLESVPSGAWFCGRCTEDRVFESTPERVRSRSHNPSDRRTRGQQRRVQNHNQVTSSGWSRVWQSVWDQLNLDLDFPFDDGPSPAQFRGAYQTNASQGREFTEWERRLRVAERQGGANRFRDTAATLLDRDSVVVSRPRPNDPEPESVEEILAWNALEKARDIDADPTSRTKKRKSASASPSESNPFSRQKKRKSATSSPADLTPTSPPERRLKRPQTRRTHDLCDAACDTNRESSRCPQRRSASSVRHEYVSIIPAAGNGPSFLQSLLTEVESSGAQDGQRILRRPGLASSNPATSDYSSPRPSSPGDSPTASNHPSPRALSTTPPPIHSTRSGSPIPLSSRVEPIYTTSALSSEGPTTHRPNQSTQSPVLEGPPARTECSDLLAPSPFRSDESSPNRPKLSLSAKSDVQLMVKEALKSPYRRNQLTKEQYTDINRKISRLLYERVGDSDRLDVEMREKWKSVAKEEVAKAMRSIGVSGGT